MLNVNDLAKGHEYYAIGGRSVSPDNNIIAYGEDMVSQSNSGQIKELSTGKMYRCNTQYHRGRCLGK